MEKSVHEDNDEQREEREKCEHFSPRIVPCIPILIWSIYILFGIFKLVTFLSPKHIALTHRKPTQPQSYVCACVRQLSGLNGSTACKQRSS